ncbi:hypothetical protein PABG_11865 [Paracoccidioides brasiliensis Pb03]|nr:hypothetical protein PABG_11865 [Paracoccidioides brasiliensis Pb03]
MRSLVARPGLAPLPSGVFSLSPVAGAWWRVTAKERNFSAYPTLAAWLMGPPPEIGIQPWYSGATIKRGDGDCVKLRCDVGVTRLYAAYAACLSWIESRDLFDYWRFLLMRQGSALERGGTHDKQVKNAVD